MNLKLHNAIVFGKEIFWKFYFYPIIFSLIGIFILGVFKQLYSYYIIAIMLSSYAIYNLLFFFWFGKREYHFHGGNE